MSSWKVSAILEQPEESAELVLLPLDDFFNPFHYLFLTTGTSCVVPHHCFHSNNVDVTCLLTVNLYKMSSQKNCVIWRALGRLHPQSAAALQS